MLFKVIDNHLGVDLKIIHEFLTDEIIETENLDSVLQSICSTLAHFDLIRIQTEWILESNYFDINFEFSIFLSQLKTLQQFLLDETQLFFIIEFYEQGNEFEIKLTRQNDNSINISNGSKEKNYKILFVKNYLKQLFNNIILINSKYLKPVDSLKIYLNWVIEVEKQFY